MNCRVIFNVKLYLPVNIPEKMLFLHTTLDLLPKLFLYLLIENSFNGISLKHHSALDALKGLNARKNLGRGFDMVVGVIDEPTSSWQ